jgi:glycosyltransferase involved in cell wall biosynthesis
MNDPAVRFSIVVPAVNEEKLIERMLRQFTPQIVARYAVEVIVSDGGSTDRTLDIADALAHRVVRNEPYVKQTISMGRNAGANVARGEVFIFLNADTLLKDPDLFFRRITEELPAQDVVALTSSVLVYPEEERRLDRWYHGFYNWFFYMMNQVGMGMGRGECHVIRRGTFAALNGYASRIAAGEDYDMFRRLEQCGRVKFLRDVVVYESPRRYRKYGYLYVTASWFLNFLAVFFLRRSILSEWKPVR